MQDFDKLWDYNQPAETREKFRQLLPAAENAGDAGYLIELLTQIGRTHSLQRQFEAAHAVLDQAQALLTADFTIPHIRYLLERGRTFNSARRKLEAHPLFVQAYELALAATADFYAIDAAHMVAIAEPQPQTQIDWNLKAIALAEKTADSHARGWLGSLYNNMGWTYHDMGQYEQALDIFQRALQFRLGQGQPKPIHIARWCVGRTLRSLNRVEGAIAIQQQLEAESEEPDGYVHEELAECLLLIGQPEAARPHFGKAHQLLAQDAWMVENEAPRLERLKSLWQGD